MEADKEQVEFIEGLFSDRSKTWEKRFESIVAWNKKNRGLLGYHITLNPTMKETDVDIEKVSEELCRIALESAKGELKEVDITKVDL